MKQLFIVLFLAFFLFPICAKEKRSDKDRNHYELALEEHTKILATSGWSVLNVYFPFTFSNDHIRKIANSLSNSGDLGILPIFWKAECQKRTLNNDILFFKEYGALLFTLYQHILWSLTKKSEIRFSFFSLITLFFKLKKLPLEELLFVLDKCLILYRQILEEQNFPFKDFSLLGEWLLYHWPILIILTVDGFLAWKRWKSLKKKENAQGGYAHSLVQLFFRLRTS